MTAARVETAALTLIVKPRAPDGPRLVIDGTGSYEKYRVDPIRIEELLAGLAKDPACSCDACEWQRATRLIEVLRAKYGSTSPFAADLSE